VGDAEKYLLVRVNIEKGKGERGGRYTEENRRTQT
jgi:hypothetical protein